MTSTLLQRTPLVVHRSEKKYFLSPNDYTTLSTLLSALVPRDPHCGSDHTYRIRSLYFDTINHVDYFAKEDGLYQRQKIRLRRYGPSSSYIKLEMKNKFGAITVKESLTLSREDAQSLIDGDPHCLLNYTSATAKKLYHEFMTKPLRPSCMIDYDREAFILSAHHIRINFDTNISGSTTAFDFFDDTINLCPIAPRQELLLEVKFNEYLPDYIVDLLAAIPLQNTSFSKYYTTINYFMNA